MFRALEEIEQADRSRMRLEQIFGERVGDAEKRIYERERNQAKQVMSVWASIADQLEANNGKA